MAHERRKEYRIIVGAEILDLLCGKFWPRAVDERLDRTLDRLQAQEIVMVMPEPGRTSVTTVLIRCPDDIYVRADCWGPWEIFSFGQDAMARCVPTLHWMTFTDWVKSSNHVTNSLAEAEIKKVLDGWTRPAGLE